jgi:phage-related protein
MQGITVQFMSVKAGIGSALSGVGDTIKGAFAGAAPGAEAGLGRDTRPGHRVPRPPHRPDRGLISRLAPLVLPFITGLVDQILPLIQQVVPMFTQVFQAIVPVVSQVFSTIGPLIGQVLPVIEQVAGLWRGVLMGAFQALLPVLPTIVTAIGQLVTTLVVGSRRSSPRSPRSSPRWSSAFQQGLIGVIAQLIPIIPPLVNVLTQVAQIVVGALSCLAPALLVGGAHADLPRADLIPPSSRRSRP